MIRALDESGENRRKRRRRRGGVRGGEIRTNRKGGGWGERVGWLVGFARSSRKRRKQIFVIGRANNGRRRVATRRRRERGTPSWKFDTLIRVFARYFKSGNITTTQWDNHRPPAKRPCHFSYPPFFPPFPSAFCVWCTRSFCSLRVKKVEGKGREKFLKIWNESIRIINWTRSKKNNVKLRINVVPAFQEKKDCCLE